jgi:hypothetical protein
MLCHLALALLLPAVGLANKTGSQQHQHTCGDNTVELDNHVTYRGTHKDGVEAFLGIKYAQDTSGVNRFNAPISFTPSPGSFILADKPGPACPQDADVGEEFLPLYLTIFRDISEDCLSLNVNRPNGTGKGDKLPVMVFIHGALKWRYSTCSNILTFECRWKLYRRRKRRVDFSARRLDHRVCEQQTPSVTCQFQLQTGYSRFRQVSSAFKSQCGA